jgi:hypothetical protein
MSSATVDAGAARRQRRGHLLVHADSRRQQRARALQQRGIAGLAAQGRAPGRLAGLLHVDVDALEVQRRDELLRTCVVPGLAQGGAAGGEAVAQVVLAALPVGHGDDRPEAGDHDQQESEHGGRHPAAQRAGAHAGPSR